ncbi:ATPase [Flavobacterium akiainvivens]|uniref:ATPase n=1 Tax=Flavobacterium akiainvivens TaxID=1202724 RepID=A0A0M8MID8_9FLAO|nr:AAA family ATPase [Flavobacterium akiainvivens]KOS06851.1 ATPase [Flavobacterium akiainvivens]SFQ69160.1 Predicted ATPase [Flavobacterium akiainvivens]
MINKLEIQGYKSIRQLDLELKPINVLIGSNGVGKSNFISFFKLLNIIYEQRLENYSKTEGADNLLHFGRRQTEFIEAHVEFNETNAYSFKLQPTNDNKLFISEESTGFNKSKGGNPAWYGHGWAWNGINSNSDESFIRNSTVGISSYVNLYLKSFKIYHFHDTSSDAPLRSASQLNDNSYLKENGSNLPSFLYYLQEVYPANFKKIERIVKSIAPFFERFDLKPDRLNSSRITLEWIEKNHPENYFNASHFSDGTIRFIALATLLLQPELPKTIIIDEPELGLHPVAINKLAGLIKKASAQSQIIISTQSVNLVNNFDAEDIITVDRGNSQSEFKRLENESLQNWLQDYSMGDLWIKNVIGARP